MQVRGLLGHVYNVRVPSQPWKRFFCDHRRGSYWDAHLLDVSWGSRCQQFTISWVNTIFQTKNLLFTKKCNSVRHLPAWFPGARFKRFADKCKWITKNMQDEPFDLVKENMVISLACRSTGGKHWRWTKASGAFAQCVTSELLERNQSKGGSLEEEYIIKRVSAVAYSGETRFILTWMYRSEGICHGSWRRYCGYHLIYRNGTY